MRKKKKTTTRRGDRAGAATAIGLMILGPSALAIDSGPALARLAPQAYEIAPGPIADALSRLADESGAHLVFDAAIARHVFTRGVHGKRTLEEALDELLTGTRLGYRVDPEGRAVTIIVAQNDATATDASGAEALPTIEIGAEQHPSGAQRGAGAANATPAEGYVAQESTTALKMSVPLKQTPASIAIVPKQIIHDQAINALQDALENVSGVRSNNDSITGYLYKLRGFSSVDLYRNGLRSSDAQFTPELANVERIEVLKGPASVLYGRAEPGGVINLVTKQPLSAPRYVIEQQFGSYAHYRTQWDLSAPVAEAPGLSWRFSGAYQNNRSFRDFERGSRYIVAPVVKYEPTPWTELVVDLQYTANAMRVVTGLPVIGDAPAPVPIGRTFQDGNDPIDRAEVFIGSYKLRQNLIEDWKVTNRFHYVSSWWDQSLAAPFSVQADQVTFDRFTYWQNDSRRTFSTNIDLEGKFTTFGMKHIFLFGLDYYNKTFEYYGANGEVASPMNIFAPIHGLVPTYHDALIGVGSKFHLSDLVRQKGFYVQDHITFLDDRAHVLLGARFDVADVVRGFTFSCCGDYGATKQGAVDERWKARPRTDSGFSPRVGLVYDISPEVSAYGSYSQSFGANNGFSASGENFAPQKGVQWEVGLKAQALANLSATLAFFQITKSNLTTPDFSTLDPNDVKLAGVQRSRGVELDVLGRVTDQLSLVANYAYTDAKVISDNPKVPLDPYRSGLLYNHLDNAPRHQGKLFATYDFGENGMGLRLGGGVTASTHAWGDIQNTFLIPAWARLDAFASYSTAIEGHKVTAQINLRNITNTRYFTGSDILFNVFSPRLGVFPAPPFVAMGTIRFEW
jgi:iron complex outermembrane receptor protein